MLKLDELPSTPSNDRIMVRPDKPPETTEGGLVIPEVARLQAHQGIIIDAGLKARDVMYDNGDQVGDKVLYGQFAGVWEEWSHIIEEGDDQDCAHDWGRDPVATQFRGDGHKCTTCGARRIREPLVLMNVGDIQSNIDKAARLRSGELILRRGADMTGKTVHYYQRASDVSVSTTTTATNGVAHAS